MGYTGFNIRSFINTGEAKVAKGSMCATCGKPFEPKQNITCHTVETEAMPAPSFFYYCPHCAPMQGSGWGEAKAGEPVTRPDQVRVGDRLLEFSRQFNAYNVVLVTKTDFSDCAADTTGKMFYAIFIDPAGMGRKKPKVRLGGDQEMCIWHHEIANPEQESTLPSDKNVGRRMRREFYRPA